MRSKTFETKEVQVSWGNIKDQIASFLYAVGVVPEKQEIVDLKFEYTGGYLPADKKLKVTILTKKGVEVFNV